jgi:glycosyltransferase involved in cell wall biosynthesis
MSHLLRGETRVTERRTIIFAGTYEREYPRNRQIVRLLRDAGCDVEEIHTPFWELFRDKTRIPREVVGIVRLALLLTSIYFVLVPRLLGRLPRADAVAIGYIGQLDMLILGASARLFGKPVLFSPLVTLTDTVVEDRQMADSGSMQARMVAAIDSVSLRLATKVIVDTSENGAYLSRRFSVPEHKIAQIRVGADESVFRVPEAARLTRRSGDRIHVLFYGKMIPLHGIDTILGAIDVLECDDRFTFEIIGSGQMEHQVLEFVARRDTDRITYRPWVAYRRLPNRIVMADCVLGVFGVGEKAGRVVPNKVFQAMAMGAPIITRDAPAIRGVLEHDASALLVPPGDPDSLAESLRHMLDPSLRDRLGRNARKAFERTATDDALVEPMRRIIESVVPLYTPDEQGC